MNIVKRFSLLLALLAVLTACGAQQTKTPAAPSVPETAVQQAAAPADPLEETAARLLSTVKEPAVGSTFGEWAVLGLARSGLAVPDGYFEAYYNRVEDHVKSCGGVLDKRKYTEYSRVILALTAIGKDPTNVGGYDLVAPLADFEQTVFQGMNGPAFALIALASGGYGLPVCTVEGATQASVDAYIAYLLDAQLENGGWGLTGSTAETDITAMALQALARYPHADGAAQAAERGVAFLAETLAAAGEEDCEGIAQVIVALCELRISLEDTRFLRGSLTLQEQLLTFRTADGGFAHKHGGQADQMATEQAFYALVAARRAEQGKPSLYDMSDAG